MTTTVNTLIESQDAPTVQTTLYTSTSLKTIIDKFTASNTTGGALTIAVNLVPSGDVAGTANLIRTTKTLQAGEVYRFPELVGHTLESGDFISLIASATGITIRASGRRIS